MTEYELKIAAALSAQFGPHWFMHGAHFQTMNDYIMAKDDVSRKIASDRMKSNAVQYANNVIHAMIAAGIVDIPK